MLVLYGISQNVDGQTLLMAMTTVSVGVFLDTIETYWMGFLKMLMVKLFWWQRQLLMLAFSWMLYIYILWNGISQNVDGETLLITMTPFFGKSAESPQIKWEVSFPRHRMWVNWLGTFFCFVPVSNVSVCLQRAAWAVSMASTKVCWGWEVLSCCTSATQTRRSVSPSSN